MLTAAKTVADAATLALTLEDIAAQTYLKAIPGLKSKDEFHLAGQIQVVDQQHQSTLRYALGITPSAAAPMPSPRTSSPQHGAKDVG